MSYQLSGHVTHDGTVRMRRELPDEETFESLAARVRPLTLTTEPIYHATIFDALHRLLATADVDVEAAAPWAERIDGLRHEWARVDLQGRDELGFSMQSARRDGTTASPFVSDVQLASAWLYADLVHADARGAKSDGLLFPIKERYAAAVNVFSRFAMLTLLTYDCVMDLHQQQVFALPDDILDGDVVVAARELVDEGVAYFGPVDSPMPDLRAHVTGMPPGWRRFTPTDLLRMDQSNQAEVTLETADGTVVAQYEAAVSGRWRDGDDLHWRMLLAGVLTIEIALTVRDEQPAAARLVNVRTDATTNRLMLNAAVLELEMSRSASVKVSVHGRPFFELETAPLEPAEVAARQVEVDTLSDLVALEDMSGEPLEPLAGAYSLTDRGRLRQSRLLLEGKVVPIGIGPFTVTTQRGVTPQFIATTAGWFTLGEQTRVPLPARAMRHPLMAVVATVAVDSRDPPTDMVTLSGPATEPFLGWIPELVDVSADEHLRAPVRLDLAHMDDGALFEGWDGRISIASSPMREE